MSTPRLSGALFRKANEIDVHTLAALREAICRFRHRDDVTGVTISIRERKGDLSTEDGPVIAIHVRHKKRRGLGLRERIPRTIVGVPTDVIEAAYENLVGPRVPAGAVGVTWSLGPGASIARADGTAATLGAIVRDRTGTAFILSTRHTLREGQKGKSGDPIVSPGPADSNGEPPIVIARYAKVHAGLDAGIARLEPGVQHTNALPDGRVILAPEVARIGDTLVKFGRTTLETSAVVQGIGSIHGVFPALHLCPIAGDVDDRPLSDRGDSGAVWFDHLSLRAKGLHFAGSGVATSGKEYGAASVLTEVMRAFKLNWL